MKSPGDPDPIGDDELEELICDCIEILLQILPADQANIVRAVDLEGASPQSVADTLGLGLGEVSTGLALGRQGLKATFGEMSRICPVHGLAGCECHRKGDD
ncbi:MAG: hypothetical protein ACU0CB_03270 [Roseovarius sp.]|jgi:RNA polymerase sigma-70 factor (ECF subfamily)